MSHSQDDAGTHPDLFVCRYAIEAYGYREHHSGPLLLATDVIKAIEAMLDDDQATVTLLLEYLETLKATA